MSEFDYNEVEVPEGLLEIDLGMSPHQQFDNWMLLKGVTATPKTNVSNIVQVTILDKDEGRQLPYDRCFGKDSFDRGGGYDKSGFSKMCI